MKVKKECKSCSEKFFIEDCEDYCDPCLLWKDQKICDICLDEKATDKVNDFYVCDTCHMEAWDKDDWVCHFYGI